MRQVIRKWFWAWEFDKEERWLNDMAAKGKALVSARYATYEFEDSAPGEYAVRLEMLENAPDSAEGQQYIEFVESTGAEYVGKVLKWVYTTCASVLRGIHRSTCSALACQQR